MLAASVWTGPSAAVWRCAHLLVCMCGRGGQTFLSVVSGNNKYASACMHECRHAPHARICLPISICWRDCLSATLIACPSIYPSAPNTLMSNHPLPPPCFFITSIQQCFFCSTILSLQHLYSSFVHWSITLQLLICSHPTVQRSCINASVHLTICLTDCSSIYLIDWLLG